MANVFFSIGSNQGERSDNLESAIKLLSQEIGKLVRVSKMYESEPWGYKDQNQFLNQVLWFETNLMPKKILRIAMEIEKVLGRKRTVGWKGYESRTMDIDILLYDRLEICEPDLCIPHLKMHLRNFVLIPLVEIAPDVIHPFFRITAEQLRIDCIDKAKVSIYSKSN